MTPFADHIFETLLDRAKTRRQCPSICVSMDSSVSRGYSVCFFIFFLLVTMAFPSVSDAREPLKFSGVLGITHRVIAYDDHSQAEDSAGSDESFVSRSLSTQALKFSLSGPLLDERFIQFNSRGSLEGQRVSAEIPDDSESEYLGPKLTNYSITATLFPLRSFSHWISVGGSDFETVEFEDKNRYLAAGVRPFLSVVRRYTNESNSFGAGGRYSLGQDRNLALRYENLSRSSVKVFDFAEDDDLSFDIIERDLGTPVTPGNFIIAVTNVTVDSLRFFVDGDLVGVIGPRAEFRTEISPGFHTIRVEVEQLNPLELQIFATEDLIWRIRYESVPPPLDRDVDLESTSADLDVGIEEADLGVDLQYTDGFDFTNMRNTYSSTAAFHARVPLSPYIDLNHTTDYFNEVSRIAPPGGGFTNRSFSSSADLTMRGIASSDIRLLYRISKNTAGETSTDIHDANLLAVRSWPLGLESRTAAMLSSRTSKPHTIQLMRRFATTATLPTSAYGVELRPGYTFTLDYSDLAPGTDTHLLSNDLFMDLNTSIGGKTFLTGRVQIDVEGRKEFARPVSDLPSELQGERTKTDRRFSLSGVSRAISWVSINGVVEKNRGTSSGSGRFSASENDDLFMRGKGTFRDIKGIGITTEASFAKSLTVEITRFRIGQDANIPVIRGKLSTALDVETRMLNTDPSTQIKDRNTYGFTADLTLQVGKVLVRSELEYRKVNDFRRDSDTDVAIFYLSVERSFSTRF